MFGGLIIHWGETSLLLSRQRAYARHFSGRECSRVTCTYFKAPLQFLQSVRKVVLPGSFLHSLPARKLRDRRSRLEYVVQILDILNLFEDARRI